jgi:hypothetical protein
VEYLLLGLTGPSNVERKVRELQTFLYRRSGLDSALPLPVIIPICFVDPAFIPEKPSTLRDALCTAFGKQAPYLSCSSAVERDGFLFWELAPLGELRDLQNSCERVFVPERASHGNQHQTYQPDLFPVALGFYLCSLQGRSPGSIPPLPLPESLVFPARTAFLLSIHILKDTLGREAGPWWSTLYWEKVEAVPLRKTGTAR